MENEFKIYGNVCFQSDTKIFRNPHLIEYLITFSNHIMVNKDISNITDSFIILRLQFF